MSKCQRLAVLGFAWISLVGAGVAMSADQGREPDPFHLPTEEDPFGDPPGDDPFAEPKAPTKKEPLAKPPAMVGNTPSEILDTRRGAHRSFKYGNYREAYDALRKVLLGGEDVVTAGGVADDFKMATRCLVDLQRHGELDEFREAVAVAHRSNWRLLWAVAEDYSLGMHAGKMVAGEFHRGERCGEKELANAVRRDRARALQLMTLGSQQLLQRENGSEQAGFYIEFAKILSGRVENVGTGWLLGRTNLSGPLPGYDDGYAYTPGQKAIPRDAAGRPVFPRESVDLHAACNDLERWLWCLRQAEARTPRRNLSVALEKADCLHAVYGGWVTVNLRLANGPQSQKEDLTAAEARGIVEPFELPPECDFPPYVPRGGEIGQGNRFSQGCAGLGANLRARTAVRQGDYLVAALFPDCPGIRRLALLEPILEQLGPV